MTNKALFAIVLLVFATLFWSGNFLTAKLAFNYSLSPLKLSFFRWFLAFLIIFPLTFKNIYRNSILIKENLIKIIILSILGVTVFNSFTYIALQSTLVINASLMASITPLLIILFSWIFLKTNTSLFQFIGITLSIIGVSCIILRGNFNNLFILEFNPGDIWMLIAVICWALYSVLLKKLDSNLPQITTLTVMIFFGIIFIFPFYVVESFNHGFLPNKLSDFLMIIYVAIFAGIFSFIFWNKGVLIIGANRAGVFLHLIPLFSAIWAIFILGETFSLFHLLGVVFIVIGIILANYKLNYEKNH